MISCEFKPKIHRFDVLDSTNAKLKELALSGAEEGTTVIAVRQTQGRGRGARTWHSPLGGLYFSTLLFAKDQRHATDLPILAGTAVTQAIKNFLPKSVEVSVKWPNDCLVNWKKCAGILCEAVSGSTNACVVGIGVNVNLAAADLATFANNPFHATSCMIEGGGSPYKVEEVFEGISAKLFNLYALYQQEGFTPIQYLWEKNCQLVGKRIELRESGWREQNPKPQGSELGVTTGTVMGIDESGALVLSNSRGERRSYVSGEITCFWP